LDFQRDRPIYLQIADEIGRRIIRGALPAGAQLPSVRELAAELRVNPNTVQHAYQELEREGVVFTLRGQGTFVKEDRAMVAGLRARAAREAARRFWREARALGLSPAEAVALVVDMGHSEGEGDG